MVTWETADYEIRNPRGELVEVVPYVDWASVFVARDRAVVLATKARSRHRWSVGHPGREPIYLPHAVGQNIPASDISRRPAHFGGTEHVELLQEGAAE